MSAVVSTPAVAPRSYPRSRFARLMHSTVGLKLVMAVTGVALSGFVLVHMLGNLQVFQGAQAIDDYGKLLHKEPALLWTARLTLLVAVGLHIWAYLALSRVNLRARPAGYRQTRYKESSFASRSMRITGPLLLAFVVYHILHFTTGNVHPDFREGEVYHNVTSAFSNVAIAAIYVVSMAMLAFHLWHGVWSMFQTLGLGEARYGSNGRRIATAFTLVVTLGFAVVPLAIVTGLVK